MEEYIEESKSYRIDLGYACFGIEIENGRVKVAPPIARWMIGKKGVDIFRWIASKNGIVEEVNNGLN